MVKAWIALCVLYTLASGCAIAATGLYSGTVNALVAAVIAIGLPIWMLAGYLSENLK